MSIICIYVTQHLIQSSEKPLKVVITISILQTKILRHKLCIICYFTLCDLEDHRHICGPCPRFGKNASLQLPMGRRIVPTCVIYPDGKVPVFSIWEAHSSLHRFLFIYSSGLHPILCPLWVEGKREASRSRGFALQSIRM